MMFHIYRVRNGVKTFYAAAFSEDCVKDHTKYLESVGESVEVERYQKTISSRLGTLYLREDRKR